MGPTKRRLQIAALATVSLVALVGAVGYVAIPAVARWAIENVAAREIGRNVRVDSISANPYTMRVTLYGLTIDGLPGEAAPLLTVQQTTVNASIASVLRLAPVIDAVLIKGLAANIVRLEAQRFNFDDIIERLHANPKTDDEPTRFALHNIEVAESSIQFDDRVGGRKHAVTDIALGIPFISNLPVDVEVKVLPAFAARINGSLLELKGETRPFHSTLESSLDLKLAGLDIPKYLSFSPVRLNLTVDRGSLDTNLRIAFRRAVAASGEQRAQPAQTLISGAVAVNDFGMSEKSAGARLMSFKALRVTIDELDPFARRAVIGDLQLTGPDVSLVRGSAAELNWTRFASQALGGASVQTKPATDASTKPAAPFAWTLKHAALNGGRVDLVDETVSFKQEIINLTAEASALSNTPNTRGAIRVAADLRDNGSVSLDGEFGVAPLAGRLKYAAKDVKLRAAARYLANVIDAAIDGNSDVSGMLVIAPSESGPHIALREVTVIGTGISVRGPVAQGAALDIARLEIEGGEIDLSRRAMTFAKVALDAPRVIVRRLPSGTINWAQVVKRPAAGDVRPTSPGQPPTPWSIAVREVGIARGDVQFEDRATEPAVKLRASAIAGTVRNLVGDGTAPAELALRTRLGSEGTLAVNGGARWDVPSANIRIDARNLDVAALRPYLAARLNGDLASAEMSGKGTLIVSKPNPEANLRVSYTGSARLSNFHALDTASGDLLKWQALDIDKVAVKVSDAPPVVDLGKITLNDFFARVLVSEQGRLNLLDLIKRDVTPASTMVTATPDAPSPSRPVIRIASIEFVRGNVNFTDNFVKPNFSANMTGVGGTVTTLASDNTESATLALTGKIDDEAPLQIGGRVNPLAPVAFLDIEGSTKGVDLPRLTSYSVKYAGYPIVKGKLSMDVKYKIEDQKLTASNRLFLDQLTFGERVDSPTATKLPVLLAVSLLKNSRGEIDINLPISGTLSDPKFSVGGLIVQVIINVLTKIVTAPFSLLAAAFGGGEELGYIEFESGAATLGAAQRQRLQNLAKALSERPGLRLDIIGRVDPTTDIDGILRSKYDAKLKAAKVKQLVRAGGESVDPDKVTIADSEHPALIAAVYADEKIPDKPRNFIGMAKALPPAEMENLIRAHVAVTPEDLRALANQRASAVRNVLENEGKISRDRMFLVEPKLTAEGINDQGPKTRVDFSLR